MADLLPMGQTTTKDEFRLSDDSDECGTSINTTASSTEPPSEKSFQEKLKDLYRGASATHQKELDAYLANFNEKEFIECAVQRLKNDVEERAMARQDFFGVYINFQFDKNFAGDTKVRELRGRLISDVLGEFCKQTGFRHDPQRMKSGSVIRVRDESSDYVHFSGSISYDD